MIGKDSLNYRILAKLGAGGQGTVYQALDMNLNRTVAIKILATNLTSPAVNLERFKREAQLASSLEHPNICTIYELGEADGVHFIVMQYVEGQNIRQLVSGHPLELETALRIGVQVADALANAHASGIVRRDIKAGNVMVTNNGLVKVLDFGLAKLLEDDSERSAELDRREQVNLTELGSPYGTATYADPEQARGERVDHRADIFSTGLLLYEMLAGKWPFRGRNVIEVRYAVMHDEALPIEQRRGVSIPPRLQAVVDKSIAKLPDERYQNISEVRDELAAVLLEVSADQGKVLALMQRADFAPQPLKRDDPLVRAARWVSSVFRSGKEQEVVSPSETIPEPKTSLAVLPFRNLKGDNNADFYRFALADAVITEVSRVGSLEVRPSASILQYRDKEVDPIDAARELNVDQILSSSFMLEGDCLYVTTQLVDVETGDLVWSEAMQVT